MNVFKTSLLASALLAAGASAQIQLIIPSDVDAVTEGAGATSYPFNRDSATPTSNDIRVQYFYDTTNFPGVAGPILINQLRFRANATSGSWTGGTFSNFELRMSESGVDYAAITNSFAGNYPGGTEPAPILTGPVTIQPGTGNGTGVPGPWYVTVQLPAPFLYDPTSGNDLLIDLRHDGVFTGATTGGATSDTGRNACSRMYNISDWQSPTGTTQQSVGLVCELDYAPPSGTFVNFTADKTDVGPGETVQFTDTTFSSSGVVAWNWDFNNDGTVDSNLQNPTVTFPTCGPFDVKLEVLDNQGNTPSNTKQAFINVGAPAADFSFSVTGSGPFTVQLTDTSTKAPTSWSWDFDNDGTVDSTMQNPTFQIPARGVQTCSLTVGNACGTDQITADIDTRLLLCTQFGGVAGWNDGSGFYVDYTVANPAGITVTALGVQVQNAGPYSINVYIKPGTHVGSETNRAEWSLVASGNGTSLGNQGESIVDISDFSLAPGTWGVVIEYLTNGSRFNYTTTSGTNVSNGDLALSNGAMFSPVFVGSTTFQPRNWNGCVYYDIGQNAGSFNVIGTGCAGSNGQTMSIGVTSVPTLNANLTIETTGGVANNAIAGINMGFLPIPGGIDLSVIQMPGCVQYFNPDLAFTTPLDAAGTGTLSFPIPNDMNLLGGKFYVQGVAADFGPPSPNPTSATVGDAGEGTIGM